MIEERQILLAAEAAHEINRVWCKAHEDHSQPLWPSAPEWQRTSAINGVRGVISGNTPEQSHESWLKEKAETGWKYGPIKDPEKKEHPCFVPYAELPLEQKAKDFLYVNTVKTVLAALAAT